MSKICNTDMHIHSSYSDGQYSPSELFNMLCEKGITIFSFTDHDTIFGNRNFLEFLDNHSGGNINYITGSEVSADFSDSMYNIPGSILHILAYDIDVENKVLHDIFNRRKRAKLISITKQFEILENRWGISFSDDEVNFIINKDIFSRVDIARLIVKYGYAESIREAFDNYLIHTKEVLRDVVPRIYDYEVIGAIKKAGGYASLAHPISLRLPFEKLKSYIGKLKEMGLDAIEVYHPSHDSEYREKLLSIAREYNLMISGGSDFHGPLVKPDLNIGIMDEVNLSLVNFIINNNEH